MGPRAARPLAPPSGWGAEPARARAVASWVTWVYLEFWRVASPKRATATFGRVEEPLPHTGAAGGDSNCQLPRNRLLARNSTLMAMEENATEEKEAG